jgi:hypothetical protein
MNIKRFNWIFWSGFLLTLIAGFSYFFIFLWIPATRDVPAPTILLYVLAVALMVVGLKHAFKKDRPTWSKILASIFAVVGFLMTGVFFFSFFIFGRMIPASKGAPQVGQKAPEFTLSDSTNKQVSLTELLATPINGKTPKGVLLVFYRGHW